MMCDVFDDDVDDLAEREWRRMEGQMKNVIT